MYHIEQDTIRIENLILIDEDACTRREEQLYIDEQQHIIQDVYHVDI